MFQKIAPSFAGKDAETKDEKYEKEGKTVERSVPALQPQVIYPYHTYCLS
jgi:hypothetical protein